jgi:hypothetical protein
VHCIALVTTPHELGWQLRTTVDRLSMQLHATTLLLVGLALPQVGKTRNSGGTASVSQTPLADT